jgi:tetratricopeptide (TPR) repeat protein
MTTEPLPSVRPGTEDELDSVLRRAYALAKKGDYASAIAWCNWLMEEPSTYIAGLRKRASVYEHQGDIQQAVEDLEAVVGSGVNEPADMYSLGLLYLQVSRWRDAEIVLGKGVQVCTAEQFDYYLNPCRILHAEALLRLGQGALALAELELLPDGYSTHVYGKGLRTKEVMTAEAEALFP